MFPYFARNRHKQKVTLIRSGVLRPYYLGANMKENDLTKCIVEKNGARLTIRDSIVTEPITAALLFQGHDVIDVVYGGDRACKIKLFAERESVLPASQQYAETKGEGLTVRIEVTLI